MAAVMLCGHVAQGWAEVRVPVVATPHVWAAETADVQEDTIYAPIMGYSIGGNYVMNPLGADKPKGSDGNITVNDVRLWYHKGNDSLFPSFYGGVKGLAGYLQSAAQYPKDVKGKNIHGRVMVSFVVERDGRISSPQVIRSVHPSLDQKALEIVKEIPVSSPGKKDGHPIRCQYIVPVNFLDFKNLDEAYDYLRLNPWDKVRSPEGKKSLNNYYYPLLTIKNAVQSLPSFEGGNQAMTHYLEHNMQYPPEADKENKEGIVKVDAVINTDGSLSDVQVVNTPDSIFNAEALRLVRNMPKLRPAMYASRPVRIKMGFNVVFKIEIDNPSFDNLGDYLLKHTSYPRQALDMGVEGIVCVKAMIGLDGKVAEAELTKSVNPLLDQEALRVVGAMSGWTPGSRNGKLMAMETIVPVRFAITTVKAHFGEGGDNKALAEYLLKNLKYPVAAKAKGIEGTVYVKALIGKDGSVASASVASSDHALLNQEALRLVKAMPRWTPETRNQVALASEVMIPVSFYQHVTDVEKIPISVAEKTSRTVTTRPELSDDDDDFDDDPKVFDVVEQMPAFPGGPNAMFEYLSKSIKYPAVAEENAVQGRVIVTFVVEKDGSITKVKVAKSIDPSLDKEAVRVIRNMPHWIPGKQNGSAVRVKYTVPVEFRLQ